MRVYKEEIHVKDKIVKVNAVEINKKKILVTGKLLKIARLKDEWYTLEEVQDPASIIDKLKKSKIKADIFTFWQRLPKIKPKYDYYKEWDSIAAVPIQNYDHWLQKQINRSVRKHINKSKRKGVVVDLVDFNDHFIKGIVDIYNETPVRQGRQFWHYGKDFDYTKRINETYLDRSDFIGAYYNDELIGFIKVVYEEKYGKKIACMMQIVSKIKHREKRPTNSLLAKTVEICDKKKCAYLLYGYWVEGSLGDFKRNNGFEKIDLPRYYIPLNIKGTLAMKSHLHHGIRGILSEKLKNNLKDLRKKWYTKKSK